MKRIAAAVLSLVLAFACLVHFAPPSIRIIPATPVVHAQNGWVGATNVPGFFANVTNGFPAGATAAGAGTVTNPSSNFLLQIDGGPLYCGGQIEDVGESNLALAASNTYLIVYNCSSSTLYAKVAVTGPGSSGTSTSGTPPPPAQLLFPTANEINLATVVCNAIACGNGGNGSITDNRTAVQQPQGVMLGRVAFASLPTTTGQDGAMILVTGATVLTTGSATCTSGAGIALAVRVSGAWRCY